MNENTELPALADGTGTQAEASTNKAGIPISRSPTPDLPTSDKSGSQGSEDGVTSSGFVADALIHRNYEDDETQETSFVPDSRNVTPEPSLPALSSSTIQRIGSFFSPSRRDAQSQSPSRLSQQHLQELQSELVIQDGGALVNMVTAREEDTITLQSDLTIADLDANDWKKLAVSYGAVPRPDDPDYFEVGQSNSRRTSSRRNNTTTSMSARKPSGRNSRNGNKDVLTPSRHTKENGTVNVTPLSRSRTKTSKTYGKRNHRASNSMSSDQGISNKSQLTSGTDLDTSGTSSGVEVTAQKTAGILRQVTSDGTILPASLSFFSASPSKVRSDKKGKGKAKEPSTSLDEDIDMDGASPSKSTAKSKKDKSKSSEKKTTNDARATRQRKRSRNDDDLSRFRTPSPSPPAEEVEAEPSLPFTMTAPLGQPLSALEMIARMRGQKKKSASPVAEEPQAGTSTLGDDHMQLYGDLGTLGKHTPMEDEDSGDDLMDPSQLLKNAKETMKRAPAVEPVVEPIASTSDLKKSKSTKKVKLPMDKSSAALAKLLNKKKAEEARGWYGIDEALREEEMAEKLRRSSSTSGHEGDSGKDTDSDDSDLPDAPPFGKAGEEGSSSPDKSKRARRMSGGQFMRAVNHLQHNKEGQGVVEAIKIAQEELEQAEVRAKIRQEQEGRRFWKVKHEMKIKAYKPYETAGTKGFDYALRKAVIDGLADPTAFPVELVSPYLTSTRALMSSVSATYTLYQLVVHPCTDMRLANRVLPILQTLLRKLPADAPLDTDVDLGCIATSLAAMGAKTDSFQGDLKDAAAVEDELDGTTVDVDAKVTFSVEQRRAATLRMLSVLRILIETRRIEDNNHPALAILLLRMCLDTIDQDMRHSAMQVLHCLFQHTTDDNTLSTIAKSIFDLALPFTARDRYVVISFLPLNSDHEISLVKRLCYSFIFPSEDSAPSPIEQAPTLSQIASGLHNCSQTSIFYITDSTDNMSLYYAVLLLQYLMTDISKIMLGDVYSSAVENVKEARQARADVQEIINGITGIDKKLRTNVRAGNPLRNKVKNALARTQHSLEYLLHSAITRAEKVDFKKRVGHRTMAEPVDGKVSEGQISLNTFFKKADSVIGRTSALSPSLP